MAFISFNIEILDKIRLFKLVCASALEKIKKIFIECAAIYQPYINLNELKRPVSIMLSPRLFSRKLQTA